jgi:DNA modification methylase
MIKQIKKIGNATLYCADCKDVLPLLKDIDSCVTDPPYGLSFMGKDWDYDVPDVEIWTEVFKTLKTGSHLLSFFGSRTYHRGAIPIEDAGFEIRDQLMWLYGSGFPKSHNIGKAVDKLQGNEREVVGVSENEKDFRDLGKNTKEIHGLDKLGVGVSASRKSIDITKGSSEYEGWGTALKPAHEPIVMARKPFKGTVANNVIEHGTGGINIDECRVGINPDVDDKRLGGRGEWKTDKTAKNVYEGGYEGKNISSSEQGRFPANLMHDGSQVVEGIFPETNSRYFYCAKTSKKDRDEGLDALAINQATGGGGGIGDYLDDVNSASGKYGSEKAPAKNTHPTVKPTELMRYLCRLVTPKGGVVIDPFMGSGSTGKACVVENFSFIGIEKDEAYFEIACARIEAEYNKRKQELF